MFKRILLLSSIVSLIAIDSHADLLNFTVPYDADLFFTYVSGSSAAVTDFGLERDEGNYSTYFFNLNSPEEPPYGTEVYAGLFTTGTELTVFQISYWHNNYHFVISNAENPASVNAFIDVNNSLGLDGSVVERTGRFTWILHLDDAAPFLDDDDNDIVVQVRLDKVVPRCVPEPGVFQLVVAGMLVVGAIGLKEKRGRRKNV